MSTMQKALAKKMIEELMLTLLAEDKQDYKPFNQKWGETIAEYGFSQVPFLLIIHPGLSMQEKITLIAVESYGELCIAKTKTLALNMGIGERGCRAILESLISKGWLNRRTDTIELHGQKKKFRVLDTSPMKKKLKDFSTSEILLTYLTKRKLFSKKNHLRRTMI